MPEQLPLFDQNKPPLRKSKPPEQFLDPIAIDKDHAAKPSDLLPPDAQFRLTNNYALSGALTGRLLRALSDEQTARTHTQIEFATILTIPEGRITNLFNLVRKLELVSAQTKLTPFGNLILTSDPFLLNPGSLWFLHYLISSNAKLIIWSRLFNYVFLKSETVGPSDISTYYSDAKAGMSDYIFNWNGAKELGATLRSYTDEIFKSIGLVIRIEKGKYSAITDEFPIPPLVWLASILAYRDRYYPKVATLETHLIVDANFCPGRLFRQKEGEVRRILDILHNMGLLTEENRLGLDQVRFKTDTTWLSAITQYFQEGK